MHAAFDSLRLAASRCGWLGGKDQIRSRDQTEADKGNAGIHVTIRVS